MNGKLNLHDFGRVGSDFKTTAVCTADSKKFKLDCVGDFAVGDEVIVIGSSPEIIMERLFERKDSSPVNRRTWIHNQPLGERALLRGYDGTQGDWVVYFFDMCPEMPDVFRWTKNFGVDWSEDIPLTEGFITVDGKIRVKINDFKEREWGCTAAFVCSSRLISTIEKIDGNTVTLSNAATVAAKCEIMHSDSAAIQRAIDTAIAEKKSVFLPNGKYKITKGLRINNWWTI